MKIKIAQKKNYAPLSQKLKLCFVGKKITSLIILLKEIMIFFKVRSFSIYV